MRKLAASSRGQSTIAAVTAIDVRDGDYVIIGHEGGKWVVIAGKRSDGSLGWKSDWTVNLDV